MIYVATNQLGFEVDGYPQELKVRNLSNGIFKCSDEVEYISIAVSSDDGTILPTKAILLLEKYFMFNPNTGLMEEEDIVDEGVQVIAAETTNVYRFDKNVYCKKHKFDCVVVDDVQEGSFQPITGLLIDSVYLTIKTENFIISKDYPKKEDLVFYDGVFWIIEEARARCKLLPRRQRILHLNLKQIKK